MKRPQSDETFMELAIAEATKVLGKTSPNPAVGAVIVKNGRILATGYTAPAGGDHAEVAALRKLDFHARGATLYSTLEPCNHWGRTGPCTDAILDAEIKRVVAGATDPNPRVRGRGFRKLEAAGVEVVTGVLDDRCAALNECFNYAIVHKRPFVVLKAAVSLDGRIATKQGESRWITGETARKEGHKLRARLDGVVVGVGTVIADDPLLTARLPGARNPRRIVLDSALRTPLQAKLVKTAKETPTIFATTDRSKAKQQKDLEKAGAEVWRLKKDRHGRVDLEALLEALSKQELRGLLVEGGAEVHGAFLDHKLVQKLVLFVAPILIGGKGAPPAFGGEGVAHLADALRLEDVHADLIGRDLMISARRK